MTSIEWDGKRLVMHSAPNRLDAAAALVTVSTGVLVAEVIAFDPPLPGWKRDVIAAVPLGRGNKAAFQLRGGLPEIDGERTRSRSMRLAESTSVSTRSGRIC